MIIKRMIQISKMMKFKEQILLEQMRTNLTKTKMVVAKCNRFNLDMLSCRQIAEVIKSSKSSTNRALQIIQEEDNWIIKQNNRLGYIINPNEKENIELWLKTYETLLHEQRHKRKKHRTVGH